VQAPSKQTATSTSDASSAWDSIHVFEAHQRSRSAHYRLTSTVMLRMAKSDAETLGDFELSGSLTRQTEQDGALDPTLPNAHIANLGRYIEEQELKMRSALQEVYLQRTQQVCNDLRSMQGWDEGRRRQGVQAELVGLLKRT
jgi:capping protein beta